MDTTKERNDGWFWTDLAPADGRGRHRKPSRRDSHRLASGIERVGPLAAYRAEYKPTRAAMASAVVFLALGVWGWKHLGELSHPSGYSVVYGVAFLFLVVQMVMAFAEQVIRKPLPNLTTKVLVPVFNEDPEYLLQSLRSLLSQKVLPDVISVADDGSSVNYDSVRTEFELECDLLGVRSAWTRYEDNGGKRHAQCVAAQVGGDVDVIITIDSDAILDYFAIDQGLRPFYDEDVQSVAGVLMVANQMKNLLTRATELWCVTSELVERSALSSASSVMVNSGTLAFYRAEVLMDNLEAYDNETFFNTPVTFSDDSWLTIQASLKGKTVQQPSCLTFTAMPERLSHHLRQYKRWMRGMTIRSFWRFKYLPVKSYVYWQHLMRWVLFLMTSPLFIDLYIVQPVRTGHAGWNLLLVPLAVGYLRSTRYLTIRRYDAPWWQQFVTYLLAPLVVVWVYTVLRSVQWYCMATCKKTGWGTRQNGVEVSLEA